MFTSSCNGCYNIRTRLHELLQCTAAPVLTPGFIYHQILTPNLEFYARPAKSHFMVNFPVKPVR